MAKAKKMKKQMNILDPTKRYQLIKLLETLEPEQFESWEDASRFFEEQVGAIVTPNNVRTSLDVLGRKGFHLVKREQRTPFFTAVNRRLEAIEQRLTALENRR